jgi:ferric-dicitrate binding protein FerR (iron transport regulator)
MNDAELRRTINDCLAGDISPEQHQALQQSLKSDPQARAVFRECVDVEASLRTWAAENAPAQRPDAPARRVSGLVRRSYAILAIAASVALIALSGWLWQQGSKRSQEQIAEQPRDAMVDTLAHLGTVLQQEACVWTPSRTLSTGSRFSVGPLSLVSGIAELKFDSGTKVVMQGPCELQVASADTAELLAGNVVVHVTELSDGFTLKTPDATIIDEGTEYAVSLDDEATEVHVFDGSVFWEPVTDAEDASLERIEAGEARRYLRSNPAAGARIPLEMRKFVRRIEADVRESSGAGLLAYDGFENLAGRIRRGRSGFGWSGGWLPSFRGRGSMGAIVDAPDDTVFGLSRRGRRVQDDGVPGHQLVEKVPQRGQMQLLRRRRAGQQVQIDPHIARSDSRQIQPPALAPSQKPPHRPAVGPSSVFVPDSAEQELLPSELSRRTTRNHQPRQIARSRPAQGASAKKSPSDVPSPSPGEGRVRGKKTRQ